MFRGSPVLTLFFQLYDDYAVPLQLYESMLSLIKLSGVRDDEVTKDVWKALFDKGAFRQYYWPTVANNA